MATLRNTAIGCRLTSEENNIARATPRVNRRPHDLHHYSAQRVPENAMGAVPRTVFLARFAGFESGGMGTVSNDFRDREST